MLTVTPEQFRALERDAWSEDRFLREVIALAQSLGYRVAHFRTARTAKGGWRTPCQGDAKGFPDLILLHAQSKRLIFAELKTNTGRVSPEQEDWINELLDAGQRVCLLRPRDWDSIVKLLTEDK